MKFDFLSGPPDVAKLQQRRDVPGLIKATAYRRGDGGKGSDPGYAVRRAACAALGELKAGAGTDALEAALFGDPDYGVRDAAIEALRALGEPRLVRVFRRVLDEDRFLGNGGKVAARALREMGTADAVATLADTAAKNSTAERAIRDITTADERVIAVLAHALDRSPDHVRDAVAEVLGNLGAASAVPGLARLVHTSVSRTAAEALAKIPEEEATRALVPFLSDESRDARATAAKALRARKFVPPDATTQAWFLIAQRNFYGFAALGEAAIEPLVRAARDDDEKVRAGALDTLTGLAPEAAAALLEEALGDPASTSTAIRGLKKIGAVDVLLRALEHENTTVRAEAASALATFDDARAAAPRALAPLIEALQDPQPDVRMHAADALGRITDARATDPLIAALADSYCETKSETVTINRYDWSYKVRQTFPVVNTAIRALGRLGQPQAIGPLTRLAKTNGWCAALAVEELTSLAQQCATAVSEGELRELAALDGIFQTTYLDESRSPDPEGSVPGDVSARTQPVDCARVRQIAEQELARRSGSGARSRV